MIDDIVCFFLFKVFPFIPTRGVSRSQSNIEDDINR